jgi:hypothetical protein
LAAAAIVALIVFLGGARGQQKKQIPLPHRLTANAAENPVLTYGLSPNGKYLA